MKAPRGLVLAVLIAVGIAGSLSTVFFAGCEDEPAIGDNGEFFEDNPFEAEPREDGFLSLLLDPNNADVSAVGQQIAFRIKGGEAPYRWFVASQTIGRVAASAINTDSAIYTSSIVAPNTVIVTDSEGRSTAAKITTGASLVLSLLPASVRVENPSEGAQVLFRVAGGTPPYGSWAVSIPGLGTIDSAGRYVVASSLLEGDNTVSITDSAGDIVSATVTHVIETGTLTISPDAPSINTDGETITFVAAGGVPPYVWSVASPSLGDIVNAASDGSAVSYQRIQEGGNVISVIDSEATVVSVEIQQPGDTTPALAITPSTAISLPNDGDTAIFTASGGTPPYTWSVVFPLRGQQLALNASTTIFTYERTASGDNQIVCRDQDGAIVTVNITQTVAAPPQIDPQQVTLSTNANDNAWVFRVEGGVAPYVWQVLTPNGTAVPSVGSFTLYTRGPADPPGNYFLQVTDGNFQTDIATIVQE